VHLSKHETLEILYTTSRVYVRVIYSLVAYITLGKTRPTPLGITDELSKLGRKEDTTLTVCK